MQINPKPSGLTAASEMILLVLKKTLAKSSEKQVHDLALEIQQKHVCTPEAYEPDELIEN